jgi:hypothetical protein
MATILLRTANSFSHTGATVKGAPLTNSEVDNNFSNINITLGVLSNLGTSANANLVAAINSITSNTSFSNASFTGNASFAGNVNTSNLRVTSFSTLGTVVSGTWNGSSISTTYTDAKVTSVGGSTGAITNVMIAASISTQDHGTPSAIVLTNATGTAANLTANIANFITVTDDTSTNATRYLIFANGTSGAITEQVSSTKLTFNPSTGLLTSTDYNSSSDITLKQDITTISNPLDIITQLTGFGFTWKDSKQKSFGLSAQDVVKVIPEIVRERPDGTKGINYMNLTAFLIEAVKALNHEVLELKRLNRAAAPNDPDISSFDINYLVNKSLELKKPK